MSDGQLKKTLKATWRKGAKLEAKVKSMARRSGKRAGSREWIESHKAYVDMMDREQLEQMIEYLLDEKRKAVRKKRKLMKECNNRE